MIAAWLLAWGLLVLGGSLLWARSLATRDASVVDVAWGPAFVVAAWTYALLALPARPDLVGTILLVTVTVWGARLAAHIAVRRRGRGEDRRYAEMRQGAGDRFALRSLVTVFWLQATLAALLSTPFLVALAGGAGARLGERSAWATVALLAGGALWLAGFLCETVADAQLLRFQRDAASRAGAERPARPGRVMDRGLWRFSRHPNYFGESLLWWGWAVLLLPTPAWWAGILAAAGVTVLLLRVSGVPLAERGAEERRPGYADYVRRTSGFVPWPPRRGVEGRP